MENHHIAVALEVMGKENCALLVRGKAGCSEVMGTVKLLNRHVCPKVSTEYEYLHASG